jgi:hypothetical protein
MLQIFFPLPGFLAWNLSLYFCTCRVVVQGQGPGPRYGHAMDLVAQRYLVTVSGNDGKQILLFFFLLFIFKIFLFLSTKVISIEMCYYALV